MLWLWPSEVAALIGLHPHRGRRSALAEVRRRIDQETAAGAAGNKRQRRCRWGAGRRWAERCRRSCEAGQQLEWTVLQRLGASGHQQVVQRRCGGGRWGLSGRLDGWKGRVPIEVKVRTATLQPQAPQKESSRHLRRAAVQIYDYVQVQCYLQMLDRPRCMLLAQASAAEPEGGPLRLHYIVRSERFWQRFIRPRLQRVVDEALSDVSPATAAALGSF